MVSELAKETFNVALEIGIPLPTDLSFKTMDLATSMLQDFRTKG
jgi:hypothetical protein